VLDFLEGLTGEVVTVKDPVYEEARLERTVP
jgi:hypothetical protein